MERLKVLWLSHFAPYPPKGGAEQRSYNMIVELGKGVDLTFLGLAHTSRVEAYFPDFESGLAGIQQAFDKACGTAILIPHGRFSRKMSRIVTGLRTIVTFQPYDYAYLHSQSFKRAVDKALSETTWDAIHVDSIGLWQFVKAKLPKAKLILNHHNIESTMLQRRAEQSSGALRYYLNWEAGKLAKVESEASQRADINVVCSELDAERLRALHSVRQVSVIPNGVDLDYFSRSTEYSSANPQILLVGGLDWYPNREAALFLAQKIWPILRQSHANLRCSIVGRGNVQALNELAAKDERLEVPGFVDDIRPVFEAATIFVCPIRDGGGTKLKVLDALAMGVPLVAHPVACEGINVTAGKTVEFAETAEEFAAAVAKLLNKKGQLSDMSRSGRKLIESNFSYKSIGEKLRALYN